MERVQIGDATLYGGDCLEVLQTLPAASVHCCITSPPYWGLRNYNVAGQLGLEPTYQEYIDNLVAVFREVRRVLRPDGTCWIVLGDCYATGAGKAAKAGGGAQGAAWESKGPSGYCGGHDPSLKHRRQVPDGKNPNAGIPTFQPNRMPQPGLKLKDLMMMPARVALALQADGWYLRSEIIWHKPNPMPESVRDRPTSAHEKIFMLSRNPTYYYDAEAIKEPCSPSTKERADRGYKVGGTNAPDRNDRGQITRPFSSNNRNRRNVWTVASAPFRGAHFATFPPALIEPCILAGTSEHGVCAECGAPWVRITETKGRGDGSRAALQRITASGGALSGGTRCSTLGGKQGATETLGWQPSCSCDAGVLPATVLDPFAGAGTTALVSGRLGRRSVGIELNASYVSMASARLQKEARIFSSVEIVGGDAHCTPIPLLNGTNDTASRDYLARATANSGKELCDAH